MPTYDQIRDEQIKRLEKLENDVKELKKERDRLAGLVEDLQEKNTFSDWSA